MVNECYYEIETRFGTYTIEKRIGVWMAWKPDEDQPFLMHENYNLLKHLVDRHIEYRAD
jgi:hypothetical protein